MKSWIIKEEWKDIEGFEGLYQVSNLGRVKSLDKWVKSKNNSMQFRKSRILKPNTTIWGYLQVNLYNNGVSKMCTIHRLVAQAFIPNQENKPEVDHINACRWDNVVWNLKWATKEEQLDNPFTFKHRSECKKGEKHPFYGKYGKEHHRSKPVLQYDLNNNLIKRFDCLLEIERELGFSHGCISMCCQGKQKTACGYIWKYGEPI